MRRSRFRSSTIISMTVFFAIILAATIIITNKNNSDLRHILYDSVKSQLISTSIAARRIINVDKFDSYNSQQDVDNDSEAYMQTLAGLIALQERAGAQYIYALKKLDNKYYFVFDTDIEDPSIFIEYEISPVHERAFLGQNSADILNVDDKYGSFNTGAAPIWKDGNVIGIVCTDIEDIFIRRSVNTSRTNTVFLAITVFAAMCVLMIITVLLLHRQRLFHMANYDVVTGLPNRQCIMNYLERITTKPAKSKVSFAMLFIDLDNFKAVNDNAGHDAGDELLRKVASYLNTVHENAKLFRPAAGVLNVSARVGGDEFIQIVSGVQTESDAETAAKSVLKNFNSKIFNQFIEKYHVGLSIGVALYPYHSENYHVLIKYADIAMYHAKKSGKNRYSIFNFEMKQAVERRKDDRRITDALRK